MSGVLRCSNFKLMLLLLIRCLELLSFFLSLNTNFTGAAGKTALCPRSDWSLPFDR